MRRRAARLALAALLCAAALTGCSGAMRPREPETEVVPPVDRAATSAALLASYLEVLQRVVQGPPAEQAEILAAAQRDDAVAPTPSHQLRYALVLATPGHAGFDLAHAQQLLRELLAAPEALLPVERALALVTLRTVDRQIQLSSETQRLQGEIERSDRERSNTEERRLAAEAEENARLRKELEEAHAKLDAIANIERSLNKRKPGTEGQTK